jgi:hypothetical protein
MDGAKMGPGGMVEGVRVMPVSPKMNSTRYNEPDCIAPLVG